MQPGHDPSDSLNHAHKALAQRGITQRRRIPAITYTDTAPLQLPRVIVQDRHSLINGALMLHKENSDGSHTLTWDPRLTTRDKVEGVINIWIAAPGEYAEVTAEVHAVLRNLDAGRTGDPNMDSITDIVAAAIIRSGDVAGVVDQVVGLMTQALRKQRSDTAVSHGTTTRAFRAVDRP